MNSRVRSLQQQAALLFQQFLILTYIYSNSLIFIIYTLQFVVIIVQSQNMIFHHQKQKAFRQIQMQNQQLFEKLKLANQTINQLRQEIQRLNQKIKILEESSQHVGPKLNYQKPNFFALGGKSNKSNKSNNSQKSLKSKSNKSIQLTKNLRQQLQIFTSQSDSQTEQYIHIPSNSSSTIHPVKKQKLKTQFSSCINHKNEYSPAKDFYPTQVQTPTARITKNKPFITNENLSKMLYYEDQNMNANVKNQYDNFQSSKSQILLKNSKNNNFFSMNHIDIDSKEIEVETTSAIKKQGRVFAPISKIFKKVTIAKPIYQCFFITGLDASNRPNINYYYPKKSAHLEAILALCYNDQVLRPMQISSSTSQKKINSMSTISLNLNNNQKGNSSSAGSKMKDFFVIPLRKQGKQEQKQYFVAYEVQQTVITERQKVTCYFSRLYCFITSCKFFNVFKNLLSQFIQKTNNKRKQQIAHLNQNNLHELFQNELQQPLVILSQKNADQNHTLNYRLDSYISIAIDIPSADNAYKMISEFRSWNILNMVVQLKQPQGQEHINNIQTKLFGVILMYLICQIKIVLYSSTKSKISQCILQALQIIKPFEYVSPVLMTALREQHQQYLSAPMSLLLGLWNNDHKKQTRQKIQIFMNRKQNLCGLIQKGKLQITDGIIINLDTGLIFGNGMRHSINGLVLQLNNYYQNYCTHPKQIYKMFEKFTSNHSETNTLWKKIEKQIKNTQLYCYYQEKLENIQAKSLIF